jgi:multidrug resistance protein MdtO
MAQPAASASRTQDLRRLLRPFPGRSQQTARLALTAALTCLFAELWGLPEPALAVYVTFFMWKPDRVLGTILALALTLIAALLIGVVILLAMVVLDNPMLRVATIAGVAFGVSWLGSASKLKPIAPIMAFVIAFALDLLGSLPIPIFATKALLWAWLFVGVPALVTIIVNLLLAPAPRKLLTAALAVRLRAAAAALRGDPGGRERLLGLRAQGQAEMAIWLRLARLEHSSDPKDLDAIDSARRATAAICLSADCATRLPDAKLPEPLSAGIAAHLDEMAAILARDAYPVKSALALDRADLAGRAAAVQDELSEAVAAFATDGPHASATRPAGPFFEADALSNPAHVHYALKTTGAAMFCYLLYHLLDWPGIHTAFLACFIVALPTAAESLEKLGLRLLGALLGGVIGLLTLIFLLPSIESIGGLVLIVFLATLPAAWLAVGSERLSYAGFQWAFAFYLTVVQGSGPAFDLTIARDRLIGILIGNLVTAFVFTRIWPVSIAPRVDAAFRACLLCLGTLSTRTGRVDRSVAASDAEDALGLARTELAIATYEPTALTGDQGWYARRRDMLGRMSDLIPRLHLATRLDPADARQERAELERLIHEMDSPRDVPCSEPASQTFAHG